MTVRDICRAASANVAAVNYHFGGKTGLYRAVVQTAIEVMRETNEPSVEAGRGPPPEDQLRAYVRVFLSRMTGKGRHTWIHKLMTREIEEATDAFDLVIREAIEPRMRYLSGIIAALSGPAGGDLRVVRAAVSVQAQCLMFARPLPRKAPAAWRGGLADVSATADHIAAFSLAGARALPGISLTARGRRTVARR